ncbi:universal stress protein [Mycolicibacterium insubricum]|uniref:Uncharacterized protein n=1 Tax=Mycolicibacterium insubricum TaxID=444597 RepID=A0A1X0D5U0_9MYCO|nr:universal stress protein [Mycolicibacterium insubricum]MCB9438892.1 universal stress protein [Mycolicibacterium sp.]ORA67747.1 hypothetical protein BST26_15215 [Mycolicibacterium insubricum]BBZ68846.1 universal stress protein [Mycolicibacterium insubricum]
MTLLVGYPVKLRADDVMHLAVTLARSTGEDLVVAVITPAPWMPGMSRADQGYRAYIDELVSDAHAAARAHVPADISARYVSAAARSVPAGLMDAAAAVGADAIVVGSSDDGRPGEVALSSVADRLLHSAQVPVAVATRGYPADIAGITRVTCAFTGGAQNLVLLAFARALASRYGCPLRLVSFAVHLSPPEVARFNTESGQVLAEWTENIYVAAHRALGDHPDEPPQIVIARGEQWAEAFGTVDWEAGELLVVGSSEAGPIERVFLGSRATKIVRHSPVPVLVVPRAAADNPADLH